VSYDDLRPRIGLFILRFCDAPDADRDAALKQLEALITEFRQIADASLTIPDHVYDAAAMKRRTRIAATPNNPFHSTAAADDRLRG